MDKEENPQLFDMARDQALNFYIATSYCMHMPDKLSLECQEYCCTFQIVALIYKIRLWHIQTYVVYSKPSHEYDRTTL